MKKKYKTVIFLIWIMLCLMGCDSVENSMSEFKENDKISVVTTIYPMEDFVQNIGKDKVEVINLVPAGIEPHDFELTTGDMDLLEHAELFVYNGAGMEHFVDKTLDALSNEDLIILEAAKDIQPLKTDDEHTDPHTWLSIKNAKLECEAICETLCLMDEENADYYKDNLAAYENELDILYEEYKEGLKNCSKDTIVVAHQAFGYLCEEFSLKQEAIEGLTADSEPDSARMKEIIDTCKEKDIHVIFFEELVNKKVAETIAEETGASTMVLNPIEGITTKQDEEGLNYISLMRANLDALKTALK